MSLDNERIRLSQDKTLEDLQRPLEITNMVTVYQRPSENYQDYCVDSFLIPTDMLRHPIIDLDWDWEFDLVGMPLFVVPEDQRLQYEGGAYGFRANYRFDDRVKRLILPHRSNTTGKHQIEICQEFFLFNQFNELHYDEETTSYIEFDDNGNKTPIAIVKPHCVKIRYREIRWFLLMNRTYLSLRFDYREHSVHSLNNLGFSKGEFTTVKTENLRDGSFHSNRFYGSNHFDNHWTHGEGLQGNRLRDLFNYDKNDIEGIRETNYQQSLNVFYRTGDVSGLFRLSTPYEQVLLPLIIPSDKNTDAHQSYSALYGRRLIGTGEIPKQENVEFTIYVDEYGTETTRSYDTYKHKIFVHFHKRVLDKYYHYHHTYRVGDTYLICQDRGAWLRNTEMGIGLTGDPRFLFFRGRWLIRIDDDHEDKVCVSLKELSKLPTEEQRHWRAHNILPSGNISETYVARYEKSQSVSSNRPEHLFREFYHRLQDMCQHKPYWDFLTQPLNTDKEYHLRCLRIPSDLDTEYSLFLSLEIILNESLHLLKHKKRLKRIQDAPKHINFLKKVRDWRNEWSHVRGNEYLANVKRLAADFGVDSQDLRVVYDKVLRQAVDLLDSLTRAVDVGQS